MYKDPLGFKFQCSTCQTPHSCESQKVSTIFCSVSLAKINSQFSIVQSRKAYTSFRYLIHLLCCQVSNKLSALIIYPNFLFQSWRCSIPSAGPSELPEVLHGRIFRDVGRTRRLICNAPFSPSHVIPDDFTARLYVLCRPYVAQLCSIMP